MKDFKRHILTSSPLHTIEFSTGLIKEYVYSTNGYLDQIKVTDGTTVTTIFDAVSMNQFGKYTEFELGNGITSTHQYDEFGYPRRYTADGVQGLVLDWEHTTGNLNYRYDSLANHTEDFIYDDLSRLKTAQVDNLMAQTVAYFDDGSIDNSHILGAYEIALNNQIEKVDNDSLAIDSFGNTISYNKYNEPNRIRSVNQWDMDFFFGPDMQRIQSIKHHNSTTTEIRHYFHDLGLEIVRDVINDTSYYVYYENVQGHLINMIVKPYQTSTSTALSADGEGFHYVYTDHLGSILAITDDVGSIVVEQNFDPWGRKRNPVTWEYDSVPDIPFWLIRGFTAHEMLDEFQLIHMNGRLYDPNTGTMLSPDNYVQNPFNTQSYNRYAYAFNNPLRYTDPSGEVNILAVLNNTAKSIVKITVFVVFVVGLGVVGLIIGERIDGEDSYGSAIGLVVGVAVGVLVASLINDQIDKVWHTMDPDW